MTKSDGGIKEEEKKLCTTYDVYDARRTLYAMT